MWHTRGVRRAFLVGLGLFGLLAALGPARARAYDRQIGLALELGYAVVPTGPLPPHGAFAEGGVSIGFGDTWELRARVGYAFHPEPMHRWAGGVEIVYLIDVFEIVPYLGLGVSGLVTLNGAVVTGDFAGDVVLGFDVLLSREVTLGAVCRPSFVLTSLDTVPVWLEAGARLQVLIPYE
jgi:hypothetical protein